MVAVRHSYVRAAGAYGTLIVGALAIVVAITRLGRGLSAAPHVTGVPFGARSGAVPVETLLHVLLALVTVIVAARALGLVFKHFHQPPVIGEVTAGLLLGPSLLGRLAPEVSGFVLPGTVAPYVGTIAQIGVILYMFLVGLELDAGQFRRRGHASVAISHASIVAPFVLGTLLALHLYPRYATADVPFPVFALFLGVALSVTAFPVLARILTDRGMQRGHLGTVALSCAAVDDVTAWCLLALVVGIARARPEDALTTVALTAAFVAGMLVLARPLLRRLAARSEAADGVGQGTIATVFVALLLSALATEAIGIHALFGAFVCGALIPADSRLARELRGKLEDLVVIVLLPAFFAFTGLRTQIGLVGTGAEWLDGALVILVACAGKFGGTLVAARLTGFGWRDAAGLGVLMNTRGLMELIVLNVGFDLGVISPTLFAMLVLMALVTTFLTTPALRALQLGPTRAADP